MHLKFQIFIESLEPNLLILEGVEFHFCTQNEKMGWAEIFNYWNC